MDKRLFLTKKNVFFLLSLLRHDMIKWQNFLFSQEHGKYRGELGRKSVVFAFFFLDAQHNPHIRDRLRAVDREQQTGNIFFLPLDSL